MMFQPDLETLPREELEVLQLRRLQNQCARVYANVPFYRRRFEEIGITPEDIKSLSDLKSPCATVVRSSRLPTTSNAKAPLQNSTGPLAIFSSQKRFTLCMSQFSREDM